MTYSGHCIDATQATTLNHPRSAERLHAACAYPGCSCRCHQEER